MEERILEVLSKMQENLSELSSEIKAVRSEMQEGLQGVRGEIKEVRREMQEDLREVREEMQWGFKALKSDIIRIEAKIENEVMPKIDALFDGYQQNTEQLQRIETNLWDLSKKVEGQEVEIRVIKGAK